MRNEAMSLRMIAFAVALAAGTFACGGGSSPVPGATPAPGQATPTPTPTPASDASRSMFEQSGELHEIRVTMDPADWAALRENYLTNQYYAADITIDGKTVRQVGLRSRGFGTRNETKPGIKVDFNKYIKGQSFQGYKALVLDNLLQDPTGIRERLSFSVFEAMGIFAPRTAHARLTVNSEYWGLYAATEAVTKPMLMNRFGEDGGNLFDYEYDVFYDFYYLGDDPARYIPVPFQPQTNEDSLDPSGLIAFIRTVNAADDEVFLDQLGAFIDITRFLTYIATENAIVEKDGFIGDWGMNNFYLYQYEGMDRFVLIPWDKDVTFTDAEWPIYRNVNDNILTQRLLSIHEVRNNYDAILRKAVTDYVNARWLTPQLESAYEQVRAAMLADTKKPWTNEEFEVSVEQLRQVIGAREAFVMSQIPPPEE
ncbi:MAG: CotH kinase family protein [Vicinamibacteria bacterium]|jgi:spore coat protein CotH|nr:CotH kinase family protein [Vicinamibacteria bacterium]